MPRRRQYKRYDLIHGGDDMEQGYHFGVKLRRDISDEELSERLKVMEDVLNWECWYGHDQCVVSTDLSLKDANCLMREVKRAWYHETIVVDWSTLASLEVMKSRSLLKENSCKGWGGTRGCPCCDDVLWFIQV